MIFKWFQAPLIITNDLIGIVSPKPIGLRNPQRAIGAQKKAF